jgi:hypothetical protein
MANADHNSPAVCIKLGSVWRTRTRRHRDQRRLVVGISASGHHVYVRAVGRNPRQHVGQTYHVPINAFFVGMVPDRP